MTRRPQGRCIFCQGHSLTKEHILADWMRDLLPADTDGSTHYMRHGRLNDKTGRIEFGEIIKGNLQNTGDHRSRKLRKVCGRCNHGWMSKLQQKTKPILTPFIIGGWKKLRIEEQRTLASWAVMFTMVYESSDLMSAAIPQDQRTVFMQTQRVPQGWRVWLGPYGGQQYVMATLHRGFGLVDPQAPVNHVGLNDPCNAQTTIFFVNRVSFATFSSTYPRITRQTISTFQRATEICGLTRIGPTSATWPTIRPRALLDEEVQPLNDAFATALRLN